MDEKRKIPAVVPVISAGGTHRQLNEDPAIDLINPLCLLAPSSSPQYFANTQPLDSPGDRVTLPITDVMVAAATPSAIQAGGIVPRRRFQKGNMIVRGKTPRRYGMYRQDVLQSDGTFRRVRRCVLLGPVSNLSERAAWKLFQPYLDCVNETAKMPPRSGITLDAFVKEWRTNVAVNLKGSTTRAAESHLRAHILPKLGSLPLTEINTKNVQNFVAYLANGRSRKTVENVLLTLSSILRTARAWDYACGNFTLGEITMPREGVRKEQRSSTDAEVGKILAAASEPFGTILAVTSVLCLRIGEVLALRVSALMDNNLTEAVRAPVS